MKKTFRISVILLALIMLYSFAPSAMAAKSQPVDYISAYLTNAANVDHTTYGWALSNAIKNPDGSVMLQIMEVPNFEIKTYTTPPLNTTDYASPATGVTRADALVDVLSLSMGQSKKRSIVGLLIKHVLKPLPHLATHTVPFQNAFHKL